MGHSSQGVRPEDLRIPVADACQVALDGVDRASEDRILKRLFAVDSGSNFSCK